MMPDRSNYETWLIDWLDGTLTAQQTDELMAFLEANPDIREEADSIILSKISPSVDSYKGKENLRRTSADLSSSQVEYLSALYLEGDISNEQEADLRQNIENNQENRIVFDKIQKTRLAAPVVHYGNKNKLKRITLATRVVRVSAIVLSVAAVFVFMIINHMFIPRPADVTSSLVTVLTPETIFQTDPIIIKDEKTVPVLTHVGKSGVKNVSEISPPQISEQVSNLPLKNSVSPEARIVGPESISISRLQVINIPAEYSGLPLVASAISYSEPAYDDERSRLNKFIARTFRGKILKEKQISEEPLKSYELAEAGIEGLNKLLGWKMALVKTNDQAGELTSLYFSSRLLKFNTPVKKTAEPQ
jgi:hypothetical protein